MLVFANDVIALQKFLFITFVGEDSFNEDLRC